MKLGEISEQKQLKLESKLFSCSQIVTFFEEKKSISYGCMGTDQLKDNEDYDRGWVGSPVEHFVTL